MSKAFFFIFTLFFCFFQTPKALKCDQCAPRTTFLSNETNCICPADNYCEKNLKTCKSCGVCYQNATKKLNPIRAEIGTLYFDVVQKYETDLAQLQGVIASAESEEELAEISAKNVKDLVKIIEEEVEHVTITLKQLFDNIANIKTEIANFKPNGTNDAIDLWKVKQLEDQIDRLLKPIKKIDGGEKSDLDAIGASLEEIRGFLGSSKDLPSKAPKGHLNLAFSVEDQLQFLEGLLQQYSHNKNNVKDEDIKPVENKIKTFLDLIVSFLNSLGDKSGLQEVDELKKRAKNAVNSANNVLKRLKNIFDQEEKLETLLEDLQSELELYKKAEQLKSEIKKVDLEVEHAQQLQKALQKLVDSYKLKIITLKTETDNYQKLYQSVNNKIKSKLNRLEHLLTRARKLLELYSISDVGSISEREVTEMLEKVELYYKAFINLCVTEN